MTQTEQTVSKTFGLTLRIEVDPDNEDLLSKYIDKRYTTGTLHYITARQGQSSGAKGGHAGIVLRRADKYVPGLVVDHLNGVATDQRLSNLEMVTHSINMRRNKSHTRLSYALPPAPRLGLRLYPIEFTTTFDTVNDDLMGLVIARYESGSLMRIALSTISGLNLSWGIGNSLTRRILKRAGIDTPKGMTIDHMNGDAGDNRLSNLRVVTQAVNLANRHHFTYPAALVA